MGFSPLDAATLVTLPEGVPAGSDLGAMVMGRVVGVDPAARVVQVTVLGSSPVWVPAVPAIYTAGTMVRVLRSPLDGGKLTLCVGPVDAVMPVVRGKVTAINAGAGTLTVDTLGGSYTLPYTSGTYTVGGNVQVLRDPASFGTPFYVAGPEGNFSGTDPGAGAGGATNPGVVESRQVTIGPQWSGSWTGSRWDNWNIYQTAYGGRAALYQGQGYGSPNMSGLAVYGDQVVNLQAQSITRMLLTIARPASGSGGGSGPAVFQASPHGTGAPGGGPGGSGASVSAGIDRGATVTFDLPSSMFEPFRTGAAKGLALTGGTYLNLFGADRAGAMVLTIQHTVVR
ncbi:hypothetical protein [Microbacterium sp. CH-015]|uniref:hypothetical protein n=1 Tax=Microbacterium sp. CH-015 TaxID=3406734 RepID=UPI003C746660